MSRREITGETALGNNKCEHMVVYLLLKQLVEPRPPASYGAAGPVIHYIMEYCLRGLGRGSTGDCIHSLPQPRLRRRRDGCGSEGSLIVTQRSDTDHTITSARTHTSTTVARAGNPELGKRIPSPAQGWPGNDKIVNEMLNCGGLMKWVRSM